MLKLTSSSKSIVFCDNYLTHLIWYNKGLKTLLYSMKTKLYKAPNAVDQRKKKNI